MFPSNAASAKSRTEAALAVFTAQHRCFDLLVDHLKFPKQLPFGKFYEQYSAESISKRLDLAPFPADKKELQKFVRALRRDEDRNARWVDLLAKADACGNYARVKSVSPFADRTLVRIDFSKSREIRLFGFAADFISATDALVVIGKATIEFVGGDYYSVTPTPR